MLKCCMMVHPISRFWILCILFLYFCRFWEKPQPWRCRGPQQSLLCQEEAPAVPHPQREPRPEHWGGHLSPPREPRVRTLQWMYIRPYFVFCRWYHGVMSRGEAEQVLKTHSEGSYLLRASLDTRTASEVGLNRTEYSLAIKWVPVNFMEDCQILSDNVLLIVSH